MTGVVGIGEDLFILDLRGPERVAHGCGHIVGVPAFDHEVFDVCCERFKVSRYHMRRE